MQALPGNYQAGRNTYERLQGMEGHYYGPPGGTDYAASTTRAHYPGGVPSFTSQYTEAFPTVLLNAQAGTADVPQMPYDRTSFQTVSSNGSTGSNSKKPLTGGSGDYHTNFKGEPLGADQEQVRLMRGRTRVCQDPFARCLLVSSAVPTALCAVLLLIHSVSTLMSDRFVLFSTLGWDIWFPSFYAIMLSLSVLAFITLPIMCAVLYVIWKELRCLLKTFCITTCTLGFIILGLAESTWVSRHYAKAYILRVANLLCQDPTVWCYGKTAAPGAVAGPPGLSRKLEQERSPLVPPAPTVEASKSELERQRRPFPDAVHVLDGALRADPSSASSRAVVSGGPGVGGTAPSRRLGAADGALRFEQSLGGIDAPGESGTSEVCRRIREICVPPPSFNARTACVCSGQWEYATKSPNAPVAPGPWKDTKGTYCEAWDSPVGDYTRWCFVQPNQACHAELKTSYITARGINITRSQGPCLDGTESRSLFVLEGYESFQWPIIEAGALSFGLLLSSLAGFILFKRSSSRPVTGEGIDARSPTVLSQVGNGNVFEAPAQWEGGSALSVQQRFQEAQREAVRKLKDSTPDSVKFQLYGFYKQATEGDVRGPRPGSYAQKEREKYDAWASNRGLTKEQAVEGYCKTVALII